MARVDALLAAADLPDSPSARLDAELLLAAALGKSRSYLAESLQIEKSPATLVALARLAEAVNTKAERAAGLAERLGVEVKTVEPAQRLSAADQLDLF